MLKKLKHYKTNLQKVRDNYDQDAGSDKWLKFKDGKNKIRVLPPWSEEGMFYLKGGLHYGFSIGGRDRALACPVIGKRGKCPVCIAVAAAKDGGEDYKKFIDRVRVKIKYWVNVINRADKNAAVHMIGLSKKAWKLIAGPMNDEDDPVDATDPEEGFDMIIEKSGSGMMTRYEERMSPRPTPIGNDDWAENLHDLDKEVLEWMSYEEMAKILKSNYGDILSELGISFKTKKKVKDEEADEDAEDEDEDEEAEEKAPQRTTKTKKIKKKVKKSRPVDDDEDEDDE